MIESHETTIIRTNPDAADFHMNRLINQLYRCITQSNKEKVEKKIEKEKLEKEKEVEIKKLKKQKPQIKESKLKK